MRILLKILVPVIVFFTTLSFLLFVWTFYRPVQSPENATKEIVWTTLAEGDKDKLPGITELFKFPNSVNRHTITNKYGLVSDVVYRINEFGIRDDIGKDKTKKLHFLMSGCSFTFGQNIPYEDTAPYILRNLAPEVNVRSLGFSGGGLHTSLRYLEIADLRQFVPEEKGIFVYVFIMDHFPRWSRNLGFLRWAPPDSPTYDYLNGKLVYAGMLKNQSDFRKYHILKSIGFELPVLGPLQVEVKPDKEKGKSFMDGVVLLKERYLKLYPKGRFVWLIHPHPFLAKFAEDVIRRAANMRGIEVVFGNPEYQNYLNSEKILRKDHAVRWDGHPNRKFNLWFAVWLKNKFELNPSEWTVER